MRQEKLKRFLKDLWLPCLSGLSFYLAITRPDSPGYYIPAFTAASQWLWRLYELTKL